MAKNTIDSGSSDSAKGSTEPSGPQVAGDTLTVGSGATGNGAGAAPADPPVSDASATPNVSAGDGLAAEDDPI